MLEEKLVSQNNEQRRELAAKARIIATDLPVKDFSREHAWLEKYRDEYDGQYVALDGDKLIAHSENGREVVVKVRKLGVKNRIWFLLKVALARDLSVAAYGMTFPIEFQKKTIYDLLKKGITIAAILKKLTTKLHEDFTKIIVHKIHELMKIKVVFY